MSVTVHFLRTYMGLLRMWRHCNFWRYKPSNRNDSQRQCKHHWIIHCRA